MKLQVRILAATLLLAPALTWADPLAQHGLDTPPPSNGPEMSDAMIDEKKRALDRVLAQRENQASKEAGEAVSLENKLKQQRIDFEKKEISDRRAFLDNLKKESDQKKRTSTYARFNSEQRSERRKFFNEQNDQRDDLNSKYRKDRLTDHDDVNTASVPAVAAAPQKKAPSKTKSSTVTKKVVTKTVTHTKATKKP